MSTTPGAPPEVSSDPWGRMVLSSAVKPAGHAPSVIGCLPETLRPDVLLSGRPGPSRMPAWPNGARSILEGLDAILTLVRLGLPPEVRRSGAATTIIESMHSARRSTCRTVKHWRDAKMALRWTATGMLEAQKGFRRITAWRQRPRLREALIAQRQGG